ncbi:MAG TPA: hypothetical protein VKD47_02380 [Miltoncostaeaceae bacterium]|nr:hypothetical protein [Miltoncostaeaceae bacterium]
MSSQVPPQRRQPGGIQAARGGADRRNMTPAQGAQEAQKRLGIACYHAGQQVVGVVGCVACQFQIRNRGVLPACPDCGELVWAWLDEGPPPEIEGHVPAPEGQATGPEAQEGVPIEATQVKVEEVRLEP